MYPLHEFEASGHLLIDKDFEFEDENFAIIQFDARFLVDSSLHRDINFILFN